MAEFDQKQDLMSDLPQPAIQETSSAQSFHDSEQPGQTEAELLPQDEPSNLSSTSDLPLSSTSSPPPTSTQLSIKPPKKRRWYQFWRRSSSTAPQPDKVPAIPPTGLSNGAHDKLLLDEFMEGVGEPVEIEPAQPAIVNTPVFEQTGANPEAESFSAAPSPTQEYREEPQQIEGESSVQEESHVESQDQPQEEPMLEPEAKVELEPQVEHQPPPDSSLATSDDQGSQAVEPTELNAPTQSTDAEPATSAAPTPPEKPGKRPWYSFLLFGRGRKRKQAATDSTSAAPSTAETAEAKDSDFKSDEPAQPASFEEIGMEILEDESPAVAHQIETVEEALHPEYHEHHDAAASTATAKATQPAESFAEAENTLQPVSEAQASDAISSELKPGSEPIAESAESAPASGSELPDSIDSAGSTESEKSADSPESAEPLQSAQPTTASAQSKRRWHHALLFWKKAPKETAPAPSADIVDAADTTHIIEPSTPSESAVSSTVSSDLPQDQQDEQVEASSNAPPQELESPAPSEQPPADHLNLGEPPPIAEETPGPFSEHAVSNVASSSSESLPEVDLPEIQQETTFADTDQLSSTEPAPRSIKLKAGQPRLRRTRQPFQPASSVELAATKTRTDSESKKSSKLLLYTFLALGILLLLGGAGGAYWMFRETRLKLTIDAPGFSVQPEVITVLDYSQRFQMIRDEYHKQRDSAQSILDQITTSLTAAQTELAGKLKTRSVLQTKIDEDNHQVEAILEENQKKVNALLDERYSELDKQYDTEKSAFNTKLAARAKELGLNFQPNPEIDDPEVSVNAFRLSLYAAPKAVNVTQERLWAEDLLKNWHQLEETWESERASVRDKAIEMRQPIGAQIDEIRARVSSLEKETEAMDADLAVLREEVRSSEARQNEAQANRENAYRPFYEDALRLPADFVQTRFKLDDQNKLDLRKLEKSNELKPGKYRMLVRATQNGQENSHEHWALIDFEIREYRGTKLQLKVSDFKSVRDMLE